MAEPRGPERSRAGELAIGLLTGVGLGVAAIVLIGFGIVGGTTGMGIVALLCLAGYLYLAYRRYAGGRPWVAYGMVIALFLIVPAITTACFPRVGTTILGTG